MEATGETATLLVPASQQEAVEAFGDGSGVTVVAGGTIVMPQITYGRLKPDRVLMLHGAGLDGLELGEQLTFGAMVPVQRLADEAPDPLGAAARGVADLEIRAQGTIGGNLCAPAGDESPRGDLQAALIAMGATVTSEGQGGARTEPVEDFLAGGTEDRLVLEIGARAPRRAAYLAQERKHAHSYTVMSVALAETADGVRVAVGGAGPHGARCPSVERALAAGASVKDAAAKVLDDVQPHDDALASAWYRSQVLPVLVRRALETMQGA
jgi:CO/xanthine dehydrogenase FAD-binding subunit